LYYVEEVADMPTDNTRSAYPKMLTINEAASTGVLKKNTIRNLVRQREIPYIKTGNRVLLNYDALLAYLARQ